MSRLLEIARASRRQLVPNSEMESRTSCDGPGRRSCLNTKCPGVICAKPIGGRRRFWAMPLMALNCSSIRSMTSRLDLLRRRARIRDGHRDEWVAQISGTHRRRLDEAKDAKHDERVIVTW